MSASATTSSKATPSNSRPATASAGPATTIKSGLVNGATAVIETIGGKSLVLVTDDDRRLKMDLDDPRLRHIAHAYATTVHAAQGLTRDKVIAVLDSGHGFLANQQTFYVEISRARDEAIILTDNREQLAETLEENTGEVLTALEAVGESLDAVEISPAHPREGERQRSRRRTSGDRALEALAEPRALSRRARGHGATEGARRHDGIT